MPPKTLVLALIAFLLAGAAASAQERSDQAEPSAGSSRADPLRDALGIQAPASPSRTVEPPGTRAIAPVGEPDGGGVDSTFRSYTGLWAAILGGVVLIMAVALGYLALTEDGTPPPGLL